MLNSLKQNYKIYLIEAWALGMFMISAALFTILIEHPSLPIRGMIPSGFMRRILIGSAMGLTAIFLIYSKWGKRSGAHINPAVTLAQFSLDRITKNDTIWYIIFQFIGGVLGILFVKIFLPKYLADESVNYVITSPKISQNGILIAFLLEMALSFIMLTMVLTVSNLPKIANYTGYFVGILVALFITFEAPFSGMSINPARTFGSSFWANNWSSIWLYFVAPISGMQLAGWLYRKNYRVKNGECESMKMHLSGEKHDSPIYKVLWFSRKN
jgi:aquaporin Z